MRNRRGGRAPVATSRPRPA